MNIEAFRQERVREGDSLIADAQVYLSLAREALAISEDLAKRLRTLGILGTVDTRGIREAITWYEKFLESKGAGIPLVEAYRKSQAEDGGDLRGRMI